MECPVCNASGLPDNAKKCTKCNSDLEAFLLTQKINKSTRNRLNFGIIAATLFVILLIVWIISLTIQTNTDEKDSGVTEVQEFSGINAELENVKNENIKLKAENSELSQKLTEATTPEPRREETYIIKEGETLFSIARKIYGNGLKYVDLAKDNNIQEPDKLIAGNKLIIYY